MLIASRTITTGTKPLLAIDIWSCGDFTAMYQPTYVISLTDDGMISEIDHYGRPPEQPKGIDPVAQSMLFNMVADVVIDPSITKLYVYLKKVN